MCARSGLHPTQWWESLTLPGFSDTTSLGRGRASSLPLGGCRFPTDTGGVGRGSLPTQPSQPRPQWDGESVGHLVIAWQAWKSRTSSHPSLAQVGLGSRPLPWGLLEQSSSRLKASVLRGHPLLALWLERADFHWDCLSVPVGASGLPVRYSVWDTEAERKPRDSQPFCCLVPRSPASLSSPHLQNCVTFVFYVPAWTFRCT